MNWISVKEKLPEANTCVLVYDRNEGIALGWYTFLYSHQDNHWIFWKDGIINTLYNVAYWFPIPPLPEDAT